MNVVFEGTYAEMQERISTLRLPTDKVFQIVEVDKRGDDAVAPPEQYLATSPVTTEAVRRIQEQMDEEEALEAYRIAGH